VQIGFARTRAGMIKQSRKNQFKIASLLIDQKVESGTKKHRQNFYCSDSASCCINMPLENVFAALQRLLTKVGELRLIEH
jgi:hypothetical protein